MAQIINVIYAKRDLGLMKMEIVLNAPVKDVLVAAQMQVIAIHAPQTLILIIMTVDAQNVEMKSHIV